MENQLFYHFWSLGRDASPFDTNQDYSCLTEANDKKFIENLYSIKGLPGLGESKFYILELLNIYMNVLYDENQSDNKIINCYKWIDHTLKLFEYNDRRNERIRYYVSRLIYPFITNFKPSNKINVLMKQQNNLPKMMSLNRRNPFFTRFITVNININNKKDKKEDEIDDERKDNPKIRIDYKARTAVLILLLKRNNITRNNKDVTKICPLISSLTGQSPLKLYQELIYGIELTDKNKKSLTEMNSILSDLDLDIQLKKNVKYDLWKDAQ